tara:strand:- start:50 stop:394 length:345 start_codon:yes stop_codon:yes gene_type:complete
MSNLEEEVGQVARDVLDSYDFKDIILDEMNNHEVMTLGGFDPDDFDIVTKDTVDDYLSAAIETLREDDHSGVAELRLEALEEDVLHLKVMLGKAADLITCLSALGTLGKNGEGQ